MAPRSAMAMTDTAPLRPPATSVVPSMGSTAISATGSTPVPTTSPLWSIGALSFSPSPMTTRPENSTCMSAWRMARTAAPSAAILSPLPSHRAAATAADSVTRTISSARLRLQDARVPPLGSVEIWWTMWFCAAENLFVSAFDLLVSECWGA